MASHPSLLGGRGCWRQKGPGSRVLVASCLGSHCWLLPGGGGEPLGEGGGHQWAPVWRQSPVAPVCIPGSSDPGHTVLTGGNTLPPNPRPHPPHSTRGRQASPPDGSLLALLTLASYSMSSEQRRGRHGQSGRREAEAWVPATGSCVSTIGVPHAPLRVTVRSLQDWG